MFTVKGPAGKIALDRWLSWARRCRIPAFARLARRLTTVQERIHASLDHSVGLSGPPFSALLTDPWAGLVGEDGAVAAQAEYCERDEGVG